MRTMTELSKLTWPETRALFDADLVAIVPVGSTEPHGPHLPLDTDVTIALAQSRAAAAELARSGVRAALLPPVNYGVTFYTDGFAGRIGVHPATLWSVLDDVVESLEEQGVRRIVLSNGHLEPAHVKVLRGIAADHPERTQHKAQVIFPDNTRRRWAGTLGAEFESGDCHAGSYETSVVLAADADAVRAVWRELPAVAIDLLAKMKSGVGNFIEAGARDAYCGAPARASREEGEKTIAALARVIVESVREAWPDLFERPT